MNPVECSCDTIEWSGWKNFLPAIIGHMSPVEAGRLLTVSADWYHVIRVVWRIKPVCMSNGTNTTIWMEVYGIKTYPVWKCGVVVASGSLKFTKYIRQENIELLCAQAIANHTAQSTLMDMYRPLMENEGVKKRLTCY